MRKIKSLVMAVIAVSMMFAFQSCTKEGVDGKDGVNGMNGVDGVNGADGAIGSDGNANVKDYYYLVDENDFGFLGDCEYFYEDNIDATEFDQVIVYLLWDTYGTTEYWRALPYAKINDVYSVSYSYDISTINSISFNYSDSYCEAPLAPIDNYFEYMVIVTENNLAESSILEYGTKEEIMKYCRK